MTIDLRPAEVVGLATEAVERVRKRQYEVTYYAALVEGALFVLARTFSEDSLDTPVFYSVVIVLAVANGLFNLLFQCGLLFALQRCRADLARARAVLDALYRPPVAQLLRDLPLFLYLAMLPIGAAAFLVWLCVGKGGVAALTFGLPL